MSYSHWGLGTLSPFLCFHVPSLRTSPGKKGLILKSTNIPYPGSGVLGARLTYLLQKCYVGLP